MNLKKWMVTSMGLISMAIVGCGDSESSVASVSAASSASLDMSSALVVSAESSAETFAGSSANLPDVAASSSSAAPETQSSAQSSVVSPVSSSGVTPVEPVPANSSSAGASVASSAGASVASFAGTSVASSAGASVASSAGSFNSMFFGAWVGGDGEYPQPTAANVAAFEALQDRHLDVIHQFVIWQYNDWDWTREYVDIAKSNGSILMVSWMPTPYTAQDILNGTGDGYIENFAQGVKAFGDEIWLRPLHEANGNWYTWGVGTDNVKNSNENVAAAYRHIVDIFRKQGVTNVRWVWTTNASNDGAGTSFTGTYPGDDYVDYISIDGYNWGNSQSWSSWKSFESVFSPAYKAISVYDKPMFIAEFSSSEKGGDKAAWISEMFAGLAEKFPRIVGLVWFSQSKEENEGDWALNTSDAAVNAWKVGLSTYPAAQRVR